MTWHRKPPFKADHPGEHGDGPGPDWKRYPDHKPSELRPTDSAYWERRGNNTVGIGHVLKYPYAYYDLLRRAGDLELRRALDAKAYHLF